MQSRSDLQRVLRQSSAAPVGKTGRVIMDIFNPILAEARRRKRREPMFLTCVGRDTQPPQERRKRRSKIQKEDGSGPPSGTGTRKAESAR